MTRRTLCYWHKKKASTIQEAIRKGEAGFRNLRDSATLSDIETLANQWPAPEWCVAIVYRD